MTNAINIDIFLSPIGSRVPGRFSTSGGSGPCYSPTTRIRLIWISPTTRRVIKVIAELSAALSALKETAGLVRVINEAKNDAEVKAATFELNNKLLTLQSECFTLGDAIRARDEKVKLLEAKIGEFEDFSSQTDGYVLDKLASGTFVYSKKQVIGGSETTVHLCQRCFTTRVISVLQPIADPFYNPHNEKYYFQSKCYNCNSTYPMNLSNYKPYDPNDDFS
jgi:Zn finger protein HypA/HybF involved in hydrogenase expression